MNPTVNEIRQIRDMLPMLPENALQEVRDFMAYLIDRDRRRKLLEKRALKAEKEPPLLFKTVKQAMQAIRDEAAA